LGAERRVRHQVLAAVGLVSTLAVGLAPLTRAQALPDTATVTITPADTTRSDSLAAPVPPDTAGILTIPVREARTLPKLGRFDQPKWVMFRSLLIPGWGQADNGAWFKAGLVAAGDGYLRVTVFREQKELRQLNDKANAEQVDVIQADLAVDAAEQALEKAEASGDSTAIAQAQAALLQANLARGVQVDEYNAAVLAYNSLFDGSIARRWLMIGVILFSMIDAYVDAHFKNFDVNLDIDPALPGGSGRPGGRLRLRWTF
jgi:hypothetical protein